MGTRKDVKVTEIRVYNGKGAQMSSYLIGFAAKDGDAPTAVRREKVGGLCVRPQLLHACAKMYCPERF